MAKRKKKEMPKVVENRPTPKVPYIKNKERRKCPRCGGHNTIATSTQTGEIFVSQHRICRAPVCRYRYSVRKMLNEESS